MKPHRKINLLTGNLLDHWEYEVNNFGGGNQERQMYVDSPEFASFEEDQLVITAKRKETNICGHQMPFSSGRVRTKRRFDFRYGRIDFMAALPHTRGLWPAVWMLPTEEVYGPWPSSGEIDILEGKNDEFNTVHQAVHFGSCWESRRTKAKKAIFGNISGIWQSFSFVWDATGMGWYINGSPTFEVSMAKPFDQKFHLIINLAVGGAFVGMEPDPDWQESEFRIRNLVVETPV